MNVKIFFVKHFKEYFFNTKGIFKTLGLEGFEDISDFNIPDSVYKKLVINQHKQYNPNLDELYGGELFGETEIAGLNLDFNFGLRLDIPQGNFHVKISDFDSETIFFDDDISDTRLISSEQYFIHWQVEVFKDGEKIFEHVLDLQNQPVLMAVPTNVLGDTLAILPYVKEFQKVHDCKIFLYLPEYLRELAKNFYPDIEQVDKITKDYYATFYLTGALGDCMTLPADSRTLPIEKIGGIILGLNANPLFPKFQPTSERKILEPYVCIGVQASSVTKGWHYPKGWDIVVDYLKSLGYRVLCIDKSHSETRYGYTIQKPKCAEDFTGNLPLIDRANILYYADFFIGLGSGLSWLAWAVGCKVILIGGFSQDWCEFSSAYRVSNKFICKGCYNDIQSTFLKDGKCFKYSGTEREFECSKKISPRQVIQAIDNLIADKNF